MTKQWERCTAYSESGGVTKTTTALSLAVACAEENPDDDVILADCDPRGATTKWTGATPVKEGLHIGAILGNEDVEGWADDLAVRLDKAGGWPANLRVIPSARSVSTLSSWSFVTRSFAFASVNSASNSCASMPRTTLP